MAFVFCMAASMSFFFADASGFGPSCGFCWIGTFHQNALAQLLHKVYGDRSCVAQFDDPYGPLVLRTKRDIVERYFLNSCKQNAF